MPAQKITFTNRQQERIAARLDLPDNGPPVAYALFAHCFTCSKNLKAVGHISRALTTHGFAVLRFDFTGLGESEGDFADTNFSSNIADLLDAAAYLETNYAAPKILVGHSLGGAAVLQAAQHLPDVQAVATIGAPYDPAHVAHLFESSAEEINETGHAVVNLAGRQFTIKKQFLDDLDSHAVDENIRTLDRALLIFHSPVDQTVSVDNAARIFQAARHPKSFVSLDQADHLLTSESDSTYVGQVLSSWAQKYVKTAPQPTKPAANGEHGTVVVKLGPEGFRTDISDGRHTLIADEPEHVGGTDLGPSPYELLNASLGACTAMTMRMYAARKGWPLETVEVRLKHAKIYAKDCASCETEGHAKIDQITREIRMTGPLDDAQQKRLMDIADKCPVHRTLHNEVHVSTSQV
ncbi:MAG: bifunctional alpha/beta hydrolase/OsmC family protein [Bacteroidota bacterium]